MSVDALKEVLDQMGPAHPSAEEHIRSDERVPRREQRCLFSVDPELHRQFCACIPKETSSETAYDALVALESVDELLPWGNRFAPRTARDATRTHTCGIRRSGLTKEILTHGE